MMFFPHCTCFLWTHPHLAPNKTLRNLLCFSSRYENYSWSKKNLTNDWKIIIEYWEQPRCLRTSVVCSKQQLEVWGCGSSATPRKLCSFYPRLSWKTVLPALNLPQNCYIMTIGSSTSTYTLPEKKSLQSDKI